MLQRLVQHSRRSLMMQQRRCISGSRVVFNNGEDKNSETEDASKTTEESSEDPPAADTAAASEVEKVEVDKKEYDDLKSKVTDLNDKLLRTLADIENVRRIARQDVKNAREFSISKFAKGLLDVSDNLQRAHQSISIEELHPEHSLDAIKSLHEGVVMTDKLMQKTFSQHGIEPVGAVGDAFDPNQHDAMFEFEDASKEVGTIGQVVKTGYLLNSRVLRPAQVGTVKAPQATTE